MVTQTTGNDLLPDGNKPLPEPMWTSHQWRSVEITWVQFHSDQDIILWDKFEKYIFKNDCHFSKGPMSQMSHTMMTSSNGNSFGVTGSLCGEITGPSEFPTQRSVTRSFDVFFDLRLKKRLSKQPWGWWFETPSWSLWSQCNACSWYIT